MFNQGIMFGQGVAGILACVMNVIVVLIYGGGTSFTAVVVYYIIAALSIVVCLVSYLVMLRRPFTAYWIAKAAGQKPGSELDGAERIPDLPSDDFVAASPYPREESEPSASNAHINAKLDAESRELLGDRAGGSYSKQQHYICVQGCEW